MIIVKEKQDCCGCTACAKYCPKQCITMQEDEEGFLYPMVDIKHCIDCGLCEKVCPIINQGDKHSILHAYATINLDENTRMQSSSGGIFTLIAKFVIDAGGVVFGARFDENWEVRHGFTETKEGISAFWGSKYVQSCMGDSYKEVERFLREDRLVLFSGTPCQVSGLKHFLRKEYEKLLTVDFICHGVPSPRVWRLYLGETVANQCKKEMVLSSPIHGRNVFIKSISFRNKELGWKKFSFALSFSITDSSGYEKSISISEPLTKNLFLRGFLSNLYLRPSCHACKVREFRSSSDITIADCWGVHTVYPDLDDDKGVSLCLLKNHKLDDCINQLHLHTLDFDFVKANNCSCFISPLVSPKRKCFFSEITKGKSVMKSIKRYATFPKKSAKQRIVFVLQLISIYQLLKKVQERVIKK